MGKEESEVRRLRAALAEAAKAMEAAKLSIENVTVHRRVSLYGAADAVRDAWDRALVKLDDSLATTKALLYEAS